MREKPFAQSTPEASAPQSDLSPEIIKTVKRQAGDEVRCVHVTGDKYRCNWWSAANAEIYDNPNMKGGQLATTYRIRKSCFMRVTKSGEKLTIVEMPA
jgi:hypothetical protein